MRTKIVLIVLALVLCVGAFVAFSLSRPSPVAAPTVAADRFDKSNYNPMPVDTLVLQLQLAYGDSMRITKEAAEIKVNWQPADGNVASFYNNNEALKEVSGHGFSLESEGNLLRATFRIKEGVVNVPNDVMLGMVKRVGRRNSNM